MVKGLRLDRKSVFSLLWYSFLGRLLFSWVKSFGGINMPHTWRQSDTLGVSYRYWLRFQHEPFSLKLLLPAVLQSGDGNGIMPMEFPLLNLVLAPAWSLGPYYGKALIYFLTTAFVYGLCLWLSQTKTWLSRAFLLLPILSYSADYIDKFIPDTLAALLVTVGALKLIQNKKKFGSALITLGLLMKPTTVVALGVLFFFSRFRKRIFSYLVPIALPIAITGFYYTFGMKWIDHYRVGDLKLFAVSMRNPGQAIFEVFSNSSFLIAQLRDRIFMPYGVVLLGIAILFSNLPKKRILLSGMGLMLFLEFAAVSGLDGAHLGKHDYYFMGAAPTAVCLFYLAFLRSRRIVAGGILAVVALHGLELSAQNISLTRFKSWYQERQACLKLKERTKQVPWNQDVVFRAPSSPYPTVGLCFGEREGSARSAFGIYFANDPIPSDCREIDLEGPFKVVECVEPKVGV